MIEHTDDLSATAPGSPSPMASVPVGGPSAAPALTAMAPLVQGALIAIGIIRVVGESVAGDFRVSASAVLLALARLAGFVLAGWVVGHLLRALASALDLLGALARSGGHLATSADRLVAALETSRGAEATHPSTPEPAPAAVAGATMTTTLAEARHAIEQGDWSRAERLVRAYSEMGPDPEEAAHLADELDTARRAAVAGYRGRIDAARSVNDPEQLFATRESVRTLLSPEDLRALDLELARWFMGHIHHRLRGGVMTLEVVNLATRVADTFDGTREGASLRAALPTLRRSVGLCSRCGVPYSGIDDACPSCLSSSLNPSFVPPVAATPGQIPPMSGSDPASSEEHVLDHD